MIRKLSPILAAVITSMLVGGLAWAAVGDPTPPNSPATSVAPAPIVGTFTFGAGQAGNVTLTSDGVALAIDAIDADPGWTVEVEVAHGREVQVDFRSADNRIDFNAELEDGELRIRVRDRAAASEEETVVTSTPAGDDTTTSLPGATVTTIDDSIPTTSLPDTTVTTIDDSIPTTSLPDTTVTTVDDEDTTSTTVHDDGNDDDPASVVADGTYTFPVGGAGSVTVTVSGSVLRLESVSANEGWHASVEKDEPDRVRVEFDNGDDDIEIDIRLDGGKFEVEVD